MTKNSNKEIIESEDSRNGLQTIYKTVIDRPMKPSKVPRQVVTACEALVTLDVLKGGLVNVRGGHFQDQAFIILDSNHNTELLYSTVRESIEMQLIKPGECSKFFQDFFYSRVRKARKRESDFELGVFEAHTEEIENPNYLNDRFVIRVLSPSSTSAIYFVHSYLELLLDSIKGVSDVHAKWVFGAYKKCASWKVGDFVKYAKYCTAYPMAKFLKQEDLPELPSGLDSHRVFNGPIEKMLRARLICINDKKCAQLFFGILQGVKRACNVVPKEYIEASKAKHLKTLTTEPKEIDFEYLYSGFTSLAQRLFDGVSLRESDILRFTEPSKNSSLAWSRKEGGQETDVRQHLGLHNVDEELDMTQIQESDDDVLGNEYYDRGIETLLPLIQNASVDELGLMAEGDRGVKELRGVVLTASDKRELVLRTCEDWKCSPMACKIVPLSEPLKVRTISAGPGVPYYLAKPFQKCIWGWLKKMPQFTVIGEPLTALHLERLLDRERQLIGLIQNWNRQKRSSDTGFLQAPNDFWVSGDYSAATDGLKILYSLQAFDVVADRLLRSCRAERNQEYTFLEEYLGLMRKLMEGHDLIYVDKRSTLRDMCVEMKIPFSHDDESGITTVRQKNGQLMGSPISFPFLCAINLIGYWTSLNTYVGRFIPRKYLPVLINGDDILFRSNKSHYNIWMECIKTIGFTLSLGKNYCHEFYLTINSMLFKHNPESKSSQFEEISYFNVGLLIAQSKGRLADPTRKLSLVSLYESSVGQALNKLRAHRRFVHYNLLQIRKMTDEGKYNLFIPLHMGGLGFPVYPEVVPDIKITKFQRRFAGFLLMKVNEALAVGVYPKKYFAALLTESTTKDMIIRRSGIRELKMSTPEPEVGWELYVPPTGITLGAFSGLQSILDPDTKYRLPSRSLLKEFNHHQALLSVGPMSKETYLFSEQTKALGDEQLLSADITVLKYRVPTDTSPPFLRRL